MFLRPALAIVLAALGFCAFVYISNARMLAQRHDVARVAITAATDGEAPARGKRLADLTGCTDCHGADLRGKLFIDEGWLHSRIYSSNLTLKARRHTDEDLARIVRLGVRPDGKGTIVMPSMGYVRLTDAEMADILAFIRSLPPGGVEHPDHYTGPLDQWALWRGELKPTIAYVEAERAKSPPEAGPEHAPARRLAGIVCAECHGGDLKGNGWDSGAPSLAVAKSYSRAELTTLLRAGVAVGGRKLGLMTRVAKDRLHKLSDEEIAGLHAYLGAI